VRSNPPVEAISFMQDGKASQTAQYIAFCGVFRRRNNRRCGFFDDPYALALPAGDQITPEEPRRWLLVTRGAANVPAIRAMEA